MDSAVMAVPEPVTALIFRTIKTDRVKEYEGWLGGMSEIAGAFPGFQGISTINTANDSPDNILAVRFDNYAHLRTFMDSCERQGYLERSEKFISGEMTVHEMRGHETFFNFQSQSKSAAAPPKYKIMLLTMLAVYPPLALITVLVARLLPKLTRPVLQLVVVIILVPLMTYFLVPGITRLFNFWLFPKKKK